MREKYGRRLFKAVPAKKLYKALPHIRVCMESSHQAPEVGCTHSHFLHAIVQSGYAFVPRTVDTAINLVCRFNPMPDDSASTMDAHGSQFADGALKTVEPIALPSEDYLKGFIIGISAGITGVHPGRVIWCCHRSLGNNFFSRKNGRHRACAFPYGCAFPCFARRFAGAVPRKPRSVAFVEPAHILF